MTTAVPGDDDAVAYVYENDAVSVDDSGWLVGALHFGGLETRRERDAVVYVYENDV